MAKRQKLLLGLLISLLLALPASYFLDKLPVWPSKTYVPPCAQAKGFDCGFSPSDFTGTRQKRVGFPLPYQTITEVQQYPASGGFGSQSNPISSTAQNANDDQLYRAANLLVVWVLLFSIFLLFPKNKIKY